MRFHWVWLAMAISGLACEKSPPLSNGAPNPTGVTAGDKPANSQAANAALAKGPVADTSAAVTAVKAAEPASASAKPGAPAAEPPGTDESAGTAKDNVDEGNGEPMDDVDDEVVPATDKSGAAPQQPPGAEDDSEGTEVELEE